MVSTTDLEGYYERLHPDKHEYAWRPHEFAYAFNLWEGDAVRWRPNAAWAYRKNRWAPVCPWEASCKAASIGKAMFDQIFPGLPPLPEIAFGNSDELRAMMAAAGDEAEPRVHAW